MKLSVVIPVYKAESCLHELHARLAAMFGQMDEPAEFELVLVEDCGGDRSWQIIREIAAADPRVVGVKLSRNFGQHRAISAGLDLCEGDWVVVMDCDLQDPPEEIPRLWEEAQAGYDVVNARRAQRGDTLWRRFSSRVFHLLLEYLSGLKYDPEVANFRIMSRTVVDSFRSMPESRRLLGAQIQWLGFPTSFIDVAHAPRFAGRSSYSLAKLVGLATDAIVTYSNKPLRLSIGFGVASVILSIVAFSWIFLRAALWGIPVEGWASLMVSLWFLGGAILANLGVVGLYLGYVFDECKRRPVYVVAQRTDRRSPLRGVPDEVENVCRGTLRDSASPRKFVSEVDLQP
jgi:polyisoprenyl-phosphate glycosyltransferase